jgi:hypothetical protein
MIGERWRFHELVSADDAEQSASAGTGMLAANSTPPVFLVTIEANINVTVPWPVQLAVCVS